MDLSTIAFTSDGLLPPGIYRTTFDALYQSILVQGPPGATQADWDYDRRKWLVDMAKIPIKMLWEEAIEDIYIAGSFVENKPCPNDIDGLFCVGILEFRHLVHRLNRRTGDTIWTWEPVLRKSYRQYKKRQLPMWHKWRSEYYPYFTDAPALSKSGIISMQTGEEMTIWDAFQTRKADDLPKGIVKIEKG